MSCRPVCEVHLVLQTRPCTRDLCLRTIGCRVARRWNKLLQMNSANKSKTKSRQCLTGYDSAMTCEVRCERPQGLKYLNICSDVQCLRTHRACSDYGPDEPACTSMDGLHGECFCLSQKASSSASSWCHGGYLRRRSIAHEKAAWDPDLQTLGVTL